MRDGITDESGKGKSEKRDGMREEKDNKREMVIEKGEGMKDERWNDRRENE
jgi:hypothetical protein